MLLCLFITIFSIYFTLLIVFYNKKTIFCDNLKTLLNLNNNTKIRYKYKKLSYSNTYKSLNKIMKNKHNYLSVEKQFYDSKDFLLTISKFIDYKINFNKLTYRAKKNKTIIENYSKAISINIHKDYPYVLFDEYARNYKQLQIKLKENKIFKILLARFLLEELIKIERELIYISKIIHKYKKRNFIINYNKNIYNYAKFYAIFKFNKNANYYIYKQNLNQKEIIFSLFSFLFETENKLKVIITYLKTMF